MSGMMEKKIDNMGKFIPGDKSISRQEDHKISFPGLPCVASFIENKG